MFDPQEITFCYFLKKRFGDSELSLMIKMYQEELLQVDFNVFLKDYLSQVKKVNRRKEAHLIDVLLLREVRLLQQIVILKDFKDLIGENGYQNGVRESIVNITNFSYEMKRQGYRVYINLVSYFNKLYSCFT